MKNISPCINQGASDTTALAIPQFDLDGNPRIFGGRIEMGCYENQNVVVGIPQEEIITDALAYPNPGDNQLFITSHEAGSVFELLTTAGQVVIHQTIINGINCMNTAALKSGIYFYRLANAAGNLISQGKWVKNMP